MAATRDKKGEIVAIGETVIIRGVVKDIRHQRLAIETSEVNEVKAVSVIYLDARQVEIQKADGNESGER